MADTPLSRPRSFFQLRYLKGRQYWQWMGASLKARRQKLVGHRYSWNPKFGEVAAIPRMVGSIPSPVSYLGPKKFRFLNLEHHYPAGIDWNYTGNGPNWAQQLNFFDFLNQPGMSGDIGYRLIDRFLDAPDRRIAEGPYPTSRRLFNWVKFISREQQSNFRLESAMHAQLAMLSNQLEIHLNGHPILLEAMALMLGSWYLRDKRVYSKADKLLRQELDRQILSDGGHFERSPVIHQLVLFHLLDLINVIQHNPWTESNLLDELKSRASGMLGWLQEITFSNGSIPLFGDGANGLAPASLSLRYYAGRLGLSPRPVQLNDSGYRRFDRPNLELLVNLGMDKESPAPYHGHNDALSFVLFAHGAPCLVDTGTSTFEPGERRQHERSTAAHNTVELPGLEQTDRWGQFHVGRQARVQTLKDSGSIIQAEHNGYKRKGLIHRRKFQVQGNQIRIHDQLEGKKGLVGRAHFHFAPGSSPRLEGGQVIAGDVYFRFNGHESISMKPYYFAPEFNHSIESQKIMVSFKGQLETIIDC